MKKFKLIALLMALAMLTACFAGCGEKKEKVAVNVKVTVMVDEDVAVDGNEVIFGPVEVKVEGTADNPPTILQAVKEAFILNDFQYEADDLSVSSIGGFSDKVEGDYTYFWVYTINGEEPKSGRAGTIVANENDVIVYNFTKEATADLASADTAGETN